MRTSRTTMALIYISNARLPSEKANTNQSVQQCEALGQILPVEFWYPVRRNPLAGAGMFAYYGVSPTFSLRRVFSLDWPLLLRVHRKLWFLVQAASFSLSCLLRLVRGPREGVVYTRNQLDVMLSPLLMALRPGVSVFFEDHDGFLRRPSRVRTWLLNRLDGIVVTTQAHATSLRGYGVSVDRILVAPNGVNLRRFQRLETVTRQLPDGPSEVRSQRLVVYAGNLYPWKGVYTLARAIRFLPQTYRICIVGGSPETLSPFRRFLRAEVLEERIRLIGHVPPPEVAHYISQADVVVLPNSQEQPLAERFTSPLKLFEYMAAGIPIVASDVSATRELLVHDQNGYLVEPDDPQALADGIRAVCETPGRAQRLGIQAALDVRTFSWDARAQAITRFIASRMGARGQAHRVSWEIHDS